MRVESRLQNAADLERGWGSSIREHFATDADPAIVARWMLTQCGVSVPSRVCQTWLTRDWATAGGLRVCNQVEEQLGERLRLAEFKAYFADEAAAQRLSEVLREREPFAVVTARVLQQWYSKYHPDSPAPRYLTVEDLEEAMGDDLRRDYAGLRYKKLKAALGKRRRVVEVSEDVCKRWIQKYSAAAPEPVAAAGAASSSRTVRELAGARAVEEAVGARYRREVTDLGLGVSTRGYDMMARLRTWGYEVPREACQDMLWSSRIPAQAVIVITLKKKQHDH